jgi:hypothetical protein
MKIGDFHSGEDSNCSPLHCDCPEDVRNNFGSTRIQAHTHVHALARARTHTHTHTHAHTQSMYDR